MADYAGAPITIRVTDPRNDDNEPLTNLNASARITISSLDGATVYVGNVAMVWDPVYLRWEYTWDTTGVAAGTYQARVDLLPNGAAKPTPRYLDIELRAAPAVVTALNAGPCDPWDGAPLCCNVDGVDQATVDRMVMAATEVYWGLSGRQFGVCTVPALRPCRQSCFDSRGWTQWLGGNPFSSGWGPDNWQSLLAGGFWFNLACGACAGDCSCTTVEEALLPSPVAEVVQVKIDGAVLAPSAYRVDDWRKLVRTDGGVWPMCQNMNLPDTEVGTWSVIPKVGKQVPTLGDLAVAELACILIAGCVEPNECAVPAHLVASVRAGLSESFVALADLVKYKLTGLSAGDYFLRTFNPSGLSSRSSVHSPDYKPARRAGT